ncbi:hypothetical protein [Jannaschia pohangensis]|uniref:N-acetyltransferase domain-containing protein n=1 Tax=Jannaschia pohangensis TaxID=390807 RepID=A0A1I3SUI6_9RHOB|nr:hypothetical protein [Jannaschia pohangensis]SFJ61211.1 hypothetical protein SAMN04488095_3251 [Jannaschia pohangensis]
MTQIEWLTGEALGLAVRGDPEVAREVATYFDLRNPGARHILMHERGLPQIFVHFPGLRQIGLWMHPDLRGYGLSRAFCSTCLGQITDRPLFAMVDAGGASATTLAACGFRRMGRSGPREVLTLT